MAIGIRDVAAATGVSIQTVSNVLNNRPGASEQTRARVLETVRTLGYSRNSQAVSLRTGRATDLALLVVTSEPLFPADTHQAHLLAGITEQLLLSRREETIEIGSGPQLLLTQNEAPGPAELALLDKGGFGVVIALLFVARIARRAWIDALEQAAWPCVLVEHLADGERVACVISDQQQGALEATQHLLRQGHRRVALLTGTAGTGEFEQRQLGYNRAMALWGITATNRQVVETDGTIGGGYAAMATVLTAPSQPTAVVAASDLLALGAIEAARTAGLRIPADLALTGFEDMEFAAHLDPALTSVRLPDRALGAAAARLALAHIRSGAFPQRRLVLPTSLHVRASSLADGNGTKPSTNHAAAVPVRPARTGPFRLGVSLISLDNPWRQSMHEQLLVAGEREPDLADLAVRDAGANPAQQVQDVRALVAEGVDALILDPGAGESLVEPVEQAFARGIPVIMLDSAVPTDQYSTKVGPDEVMVGKITAEDLIERMGFGNIVILEGPAGWPVVEERSRGMMLALRQHREVRVLASASVPNWSRQRAKEIMRDWLLLFPTINGILAQDGLMAMGALEAALEAGRAESLRIGMIGTYNRALRYLTEVGEGKSVLIPTWIGAECVRVALRILRGEQAPKWIDHGGDRDHERERRRLVRTVPAARSVRQPVA